MMPTVQTFLMLIVYLIIVEDAVQDSMIQIMLKLLMNVVSMGYTLREVEVVT